ncbi:MAG TPA: uracil-DNA glycosylase [Candidatus Angelobacter sp.]|nr:uracil-DNA glycosylase [Candidatus Angelobacter sp.]
MRKALNPETKKQVVARVNYYREMGIHDFYRQPLPESTGGGLSEQGPQADDVVASGRSVTLFDSPLPVIEDRPAALKAIRADIGDCTRCRLHKGRKNIVFGVGNVNADLMFVGEGPGADEDEQGEPFVGRAGQLLNNMIAAMGLKRGDVYIANVVKCRPPQNRTPEKDECDTCSPFLMRQIEVIRPKVIVALGAVAAKNLLAMNDSMASLRGRWYDFKGARLAVTYHPAYLLRDPRQKKEAWKDLQMVMKYLGLKAKAGAPSGH